MRELYWAGGFSLTVLAAIFSFVILGWPGDINNCADVADIKDNTCYCEEYKKEDIGKPGIRQKFNTLSNLYAIGTGTLVGWFIWRNRKRGYCCENESGGPLQNKDNRMCHTSFYPIFYLCVLIYLGLGSMWFHASIVEWAGLMDQISMFTFVSFLIAYSLVRATNKDLAGYITYPFLVVSLTLGGGQGIDSALLIGIGVLFYMAIQGYIWWRMEHVRNTMATFWKFWFTAALCMGAAVAVWIPSQTGGPLCLDTHVFQFHGLWHWLAGAMGVLLYFYWIKAPR